MMTFVIFVPLKKPLYNSHWVLFWLWKFAKEKKNTDDNQLTGNTYKNNFQFALSGQKL